MSDISGGTYRSMVAVACIETRCTSTCGSSPESTRASVTRGAMTEAENSLPGSSGTKS